MNKNRVSLASREIDPFAQPIPDLFTVWQHFKGGLYIVTDIVTDSETLEDKVIYVAIGTGKKWERSLSEWNEHVPPRNPLVRPESAMIPRFTLALGRLTGNGDT